jgi:hypothetical protein
MKTAAFASKIKTAAVAAAIVIGIAGSAAAQGVNPFVGGDVPNNTPNVNIPNPNQGNQYGNNQGNQYGNMDARLARYLVGSWVGRLNDGQTVRVAFLQDGRFMMATQGAQVAVMGRYTVSGGQLQFQIVGRCNLSTRQCENLAQAQTTTIAFRPVDQQTITVQDGTFRRVG